MPVFTRNSRRRSVCGVARDGRAEQRVVVAGQELGRRVHDDVGALVERAQVDRRRRRSRRRRRGPGARAGPPSSGSVSIGFAGASTQTMSASGGASRWSNSTSSGPHGSSSPSSSRCRSRRPRRARSSRRRRAKAGATLRRGARARRVEERVAALERARAPARPRRRPGGRSASSRTGAAPPPVVGPDRRAVDRHAPTLRRGHGLPGHVRCQPPVVRCDILVHRHLLARCHLGSARDGAGREAHALHHAGAARLAR